MDAFSVAVSVGLQYGVPLEDYASKFINMKFEPSGMTDDPDIRFASSVVDYVFRRLALDHLPPEKRESLGIRSIGERKVEAAEKTAEPTAVEEAPLQVSEDAVVRPIELVPSRPGLGRAALLPVRLPDAARGVVLRLRHLRQHERLLLRGHPRRFRPGGLGTAAPATDVGSTSGRGGVHGTAARDRVEPPTWRSRLTRGAWARSACAGRLGLPEMTCGTPCS